MSAPIEIRRFRKRYKNATVEHGRLTFEGRITFLLGDNGSGKTTLLKAMAGLIHFEGTISGCENAVYIPEIPALPEGLRVKSYLHLLGEISGYEKARLEGLLGRFHLKKKRDVLLKDLSKGMRQKVNLVQGLLLPRSVYLIDEPASGLDAETKAALSRFIAESDARFVCATHSPETFASLNGQCVRL